MELTPNKLKLPRQVAIAVGRDSRVLEMEMWDSKRTAVLPAGVAVNKDRWLSLLSKPGPKSPEAPSGAPSGRPPSQGLPVRLCIDRISTATC